MHNAVRILLFSALFLDMFLFSASIGRAQDTLPSPSPSPSDPVPTETQG